MTVATEPGRRVRRVRLRARSDALVRRGALLLEDALRTATVPAAPGRVLLVRSLDVGPIQSDAGPATLALAIERRLAAVALEAVHGADPSAGGAAAVYFRDEVEAQVALAGRLARGGAATEWFWPLAIEGFREPASREDALRALLEHAAASASGIWAVARIVNELAEDATLDALLRALGPRDGEALARAAAVWPTPPDRGGGEVAAHPTLVAALGRWISAWTAADPRSAWLASMALVAARPTRVLDPSLGERAAALVARTASAAALVARTATAAGPSGEAQAAAALDETPRAGPNQGEPRRTAANDSEGASIRPADPGDVLGRAATNDSEGASIRPADPGDRVGRSTAAQPPSGAPGEPALNVEGGAPTPAEGPPLAPAARRTRDPATGAPTAHPAAPAVESSTVARPPAPRRARYGASAPLGEPTAFGGLLFLLAVLEQIGITSLLERQPALLEHDVPARVLLAVADRLAAPVDDPMRVHVEDLLLGAAAPVAAEPVATVVVEARRWCRRNARLGLHALVRRWAFVAGTRTHVDVTFDLQAVDIRVRRAGLDIDPGWVPWLGRVVHFHYVRGLDGR